MKYKELPIDYNRVNINGVVKVGKTVVDKVGFVKPLSIYHNIIPDRTE